MLIDFFDVLEKIARCHNVNLTIIKGEMEEFPDFDLGIRRILFPQEEERRFLKMIGQLKKKDTLYYLFDYFETEYCVMPIPEEEREKGNFIILGPYRNTILDEANLQELIEVKLIPREHMGDLREYYNVIPVMASLPQWKEICLFLYRLLCRNEMIQTEYVSQISPESSFQMDSPKNDLTIKIVEERYAMEGALMKAVTNGDMENALKIKNIMGGYKPARRYKDPIRDGRNSLIIYNTLLRKAAERGGVNPVYLDALSTQIAKRVETINNDQEFDRFMIEMLRKYCLLVQNYSLRGYSPVIQKVVNHINLNITEELSLKYLSEQYCVNASYLSTLFKREMKITLTDYINQQRIREAVTLLNSTTMQIQDIASKCGIYDVNYFRKLFKKITGMTPTEYTRQIRSHCRTDSGY